MSHEMHTPLHGILGLSRMLRSSLPDDLWLQIDPDRLRQILTNLVGNAVKFTVQGHVSVHLSLQAPSEEAQDEGVCRVFFEVQDTGRGIPEAHLERIFDAFHQVDARDDCLAGGTGLGLSISQQICLAMGAKLHCESLGLAVSVADHGLRALQWLRTTGADLVLMDFHMPEMGGIEATRRIRELEVQQGWVPMPIVAMSAGDQIDDHRHCLVVGMDDYVSKPFMPRNMNLVLRRHLQHLVQRRCCVAEKAPA